MIAHLNHFYPGSGRNRIGRSGSPWPGEGAGRGVAVFVVCTVTLFWVLSDVIVERSFLRPAPSLLQSGLV